MKRFLTAGLGMVLLGAAGLLILHQAVEFPPRAGAQAGGGAAAPPGGIVPAVPGGAVEAGQYRDIVPPLLDGLADADGGVRQLAAATLVATGRDAVAPLIEALKSKDRDTRANAAYVLGHLGEAAREALPALAKALKDEDKEVRRRAAYALHSIVSRHQAAALSTAAAESPEGAASPIVAMPLQPMQTPLDPGLLLPAAKAQEPIPGPRTEKEKKD
jgi:hypothetical protein